MLDASRDAVEGLKNTSAASENEDLCLALQQHNDLVEQYSTGCKEVAEAKARLWALKRKTLGMCTILQEQLHA